MLDYKKFKKDIFSISEESFLRKCLDAFEYQFEFNQTYRHYCDRLGRHPENVKSLDTIPFLPIEFFKTHEIKTEDWHPEKVFESSGTTGQIKSRHLVRDLSFYHQVAKSIFESNYGSLSDYQIVALLPSYQEQQNSSLINMVDHFMTLANSASSYYLSNHKKLRENIADSNFKIILIGVSFALLDLAESPLQASKDIVVLETGGMKGRRREMIRAELHEYLSEGLQVRDIHSEYGMTELTSQAYFKGASFHLPPWAKVLIRDVNDPFSYQDQGKTGGINIIDLANISSCCFIETKDLGLIVSKDAFQVLGRFDNSDIRGCNLMI